MKKEEEEGKTLEYIKYEDDRSIHSYKMNAKIVLVNGKAQIDNNVNENLTKTELVIEKVRLTTSNSYKNNNNHTDKWSEQETLKFYRVQF